MQRSVTTRTAMDRWTLFDLKQHHVNSELFVHVVCVY